MTSVTPMCITCCPKITRRGASAALLLLVAGAARADAVTVQAEPVELVLGEYIAEATLTERGWIGLTYDVTRQVLVGPRRGQVVVAAPGSPEVVAAGPRLYVRYGDIGRPAGAEPMNRIDGNRLVPLSGVPSFSWAFAGGRRTIGVGNDRELADAEARWHVLDVSAMGGVLARAADPEAAVGAVRLHGELVVAVRAPAPSESTLRVEPIPGALHGDGPELLQLNGPPSGALVHLRSDGKVLRRELVTGQRPIGLAATDKGWLVVVLEGSHLHAFTDGAVLARRPGAEAVTLLAHDLTWPRDVVQGGRWVCLREELTRTSVVHCFDPGRRLHVKTQTFDGNVILFGVEDGKRPRVVFREPYPTKHVQAAPLPP